MSEGMAGTSAGPEVDIDASFSSAYHAHLHRRGWADFLSSAHTTRIREVGCAVALLTTHQRLGENYGYPNLLAKTWSLPSWCLPGPYPPVWSVGASPCFPLPEKWWPFSSELKTVDPHILSRIRKAHVALAAFSCTGGRRAEGVLFAQCGAVGQLPWVSATNVAWKKDLMEVLPPLAKGYMSWDTAWSLECLKQQLVMGGRNGFQQAWVLLYDISALHSLGRVAEHAGAKMALCTEHDRTRSTRSTMS